MICVISETAGLCNKKRLTSARSSASSSSGARSQSSTSGGAGGSRDARAAASARRSAEQARSTCAPRARRSRASCSCARAQPGGGEAGRAPGQHPAGAGSAGGSTRRPATRRHSPSGSHGVRRHNAGAAGTHTCSKLSSISTCSEKCCTFKLIALARRHIPLSKEVEQRGRKEEGKKLTSSVRQGCAPDAKQSGRPHHRRVQAGAPPPHQHALQPHHHVPLPTPHAPSPAPGSRLCPTSSSSSVRSGPDPAPLSSASTPRPAITAMRY